MLELDPFRCTVSLGEIGGEIKVGKREEHVFSGFQGIPPVPFFFYWSSPVVDSLSLISMST